jgi:Hint domain
MPTYPKPNEYFKYAFSVTASGGTYTVGSRVGTFGGTIYGVGSSPNYAPNGATQLSDVSPDNHYENATLHGAGHFLGVYVGETSNGQSFVGEYRGGGLYLYTNNSYALGSTPTITHTTFNIPCYVTGTLIRTVAGDVAVESLSIGDEVLTASGEVRPIKWIGRRSYAGRFVAGKRALLPICFKEGSIDEGVPQRDLWVSPKHAMYLDGVLISAEFLLNGVSVTQPDRVDDVSYFHVELETHDVILAEGAQSESFVNDDSRNMFNNAHEFAVLYPNLDGVEARYCAPRVEDGYGLEAVRSRLVKRAGLPVAAPVTFGTLRGNVDRFDAKTVSGWAQDQNFPHGPVCLDVMIDSSMVVRVLAQRYRPDLLVDGIGDGHHGFEFHLPVPLSRNVRHFVEVRRSADGALCGSNVLEAMVDATAELVAA